ncbi:ARID DNA-binding domain-containing protein [Tanacetum coccineum]
MGNMLNKYQQMVSELSNDQGNEGSWIKRKLNNICLKRLHDINNKIEILESQQENRNKEELKAKRLKKVRCYKCKEKGHFVNNCPVWKKNGKAKIVEEVDKESVAENHKPTIGKLKPRFDVEIIGDKCNITHMFDPINGKKDNKSQSERMEDGLNGQDQIEVNGKIESLKVHTTEEFIQFMELMNTNKISYKHKEVFTRKFNDTLKWFHNAKAGKDLEGKLPPKISNVEICLFDFYKFVNNCGDLKKIFEDYLLHPHTYYEFAKGRQRDKHTKGLGTFKDQGDGRKPNKYTKGLATFKDQGEGRKPNKYTERLDQGEGRKPNKYTERLGTFKDQGEGRKPNKYTKGLGTFEDQGEGRKPNKYTKGLDQAEGLADHFRTSAVGMDIASKHASTNKALKEIKKEDDDFPIV